MSIFQYINYTQVFTLTTSQTTNILSNITLISNDLNNVISNTWQCDNTNYNSLCLYVTIFNSECPDIETISITTEGASIISGNVDPFFVFAVKNSDSTWDFVSFFADWDGAASLGGGTGATGGVFVAPNCANTQLLNTNNIFTIWSDYNDGTMTEWDDNRIALSNGDIYNWEKLTGSRLNNPTDPITITVENDLIRNTATIRFSEDSIGTVNCAFNQAFDTVESGNDWIVLAMSANGVVSYSKFTVEQECERTLNPTPHPTIYPTSGRHTFKVNNSCINIQNKNTNAKHLMLAHMLSGTRDLLSVFVFLCCVRT